MRVLQSLTLASLVFVLAGCAGPGPKALTPEATADPWAAWLSGAGAEMPSVAVTGHAGGVVVAVLDTGVDPFHPVFQSAARSGVDGLGVLAEPAPVRIPLGRVQEAAATERLVDAMQPGTLYWFEGTSLLYYSMAEPSAGLDPDGHGTAVASLVAQAAPQAWIVVVQAQEATDLEALEWAVDQPWIDVITQSAGCLLNCVTSVTSNAALTDDAEEARVLQLRRAWRDGKLLVNSAGNDPTPTLADPNDSPPWVIGVGGYDPVWNGEAVGASKGVDVVANFTATVAQAGGDGWMTVAGTSFAAPVVAGTLAAAWADLRSAGVVATNQQLRAGLNATAVYPETEDYDPTAPRPTYPGSPTTALQESVAAVGVPVAPQPWLQTGWGWVHAGLVPALRDGVANGSLPEKSTEATLYMAERQAIRNFYWDP